MILSKKIISNFIPTINQIDNEKIVEALIAIGVEVEQVMHFPQMDFLRIGKIVAIKKHPHAAQLTICKVQLGETQFNEIVCGAKNVASDDAINKYAIVALEGAEFPDGRIIAAKNIRGVVSEGMLCAYEELNVNYKKYVATEDLDDVILLEDAKPFDTDISKYINSDDTMFEISLPYNRPDWQGVRFISLELAGYLKQKFVKKITYLGEHKFINSPIDAINNADRFCNYFGGIYLRNWQVKSSSWNLKGLLINNQIRPINDIVDYMTLISLLTGNPIHVHDADKINGAIKVEQAKEMMQMVGLDNKTYDIMPGDLIITDDEKILALAGVIGSKASMVSKETTNFFIEIANFSRHEIQKTANRLKLSTLASQMFSREIPLYATQLTFDHVYEYLTKNILPQQISRPTKKLNLDEYSKEIVVNFQNIVNLLGYTKNLSELKMRSIWNSLGFNASSNRVLIPAYRKDINVWEDLAEELVKILNINSFEPEPILANYILDQDNKNYEMIQSLSSKLRNLQISNVHTYNLTSLSKAKQFDFFNHGEPMRMRHSLSSDREYFRLNVIGNLLDVLQYNKVRKNGLQALFEIQNLVSLESANMHIGIVVPVPLFKTSYNSQAIPSNLLTMKGLSELIVNNFGFNCNYEPVEESRYLSENDALKLVVYQEIIGFIGKIRPSLLKAYDLQDLDVYVLDINLEPLIKSLNRIESVYEPISKLQNIERDITLQILKENNFEHFVKAIATVNEIKKWELISVFNPPENNTPLKEGINSFLSNLYTIRNAPVLLPGININYESSTPKNINVTTSPNVPTQNISTLKPQVESSEFIDKSELDKFAPTRYTVRYYINQGDKTLTLEEINEITKKLLRVCKSKNIFIHE
ncbi:phenylalanine--tRNA ligase subunit beta [[Mycoplasma] testudinis]|uniref:phenylalanine--tRNA ligase subunit beta n=1 Tax=[Mycoplasma] testudinis TaxID=33924 RepID=UPI0004867CE4|nr:phenylalanine--tRNA ligase subunit beta [[Mycoplasma] testudinis]